MNPEALREMDFGRIMTHTDSPSASFHALEPLLDNAMGPYLALLPNELVAELRNVAHEAFEFLDERLAAMLTEAGLVVSHAKPSQFLGRQNALAAFENLRETYRHLGQTRDTENPERQATD